MNPIIVAVLLAVPLAGLLLLIGIVADAFSPPSRTILPPPRRYADELRRLQAELQSLRNPGE